VRLSHVLAWLKAHQPDVLALQETKLIDADFPVEDIQKAGYEVYFSGQKTYNGMAILTRQFGSDIITDISGFQDVQRRFLGITIQGIRIFNVYVPNGESVESEKYQYKLNWLRHLTHYLKEELVAHPRIIILGDFNIAPEEMDVHDPNAWEGHVLFSQPERSALRDILTLGFHDCFRERWPEEQSFSWWDYRLNAFKRNLGLRIDHILATAALNNVCQECYIDKAERALERPSDHAPVVAEFFL
jgi:exodeoxyribonuclease-3